MALDIDGTLLGSDKDVSPRTHGAVAAARRGGMKLVLVTGRRYPAARQVAEQLGGEIPLVLHNGALIVEGGVVLRCRPLAREVARRTLRLGRARGVDAVVHAGQHGEGRLLVERIPPGNSLLARYLERAGPDVLHVSDLDAALAVSEEDPIQVMFGGPAQTMDALLPALRAGLGVAARIESTRYPRYSVGIIDVLDPGVGKAQALAVLQKRWRIPAVQTLAIGDNWNDREMLEQAGLGLVMGNADPELLALGLPALPSNDEDGVAVALERYVLAPLQSKRG